MTLIRIGSPSRIRTRVMASRVPYDGPLHQGTGISRTRCGYFKTAQDLNPEFTFSKLSSLGLCMFSGRSTRGDSHSPRESVAVGTSES